MEFFTTPNSKNVIATLRIITIEKSELTFLLILYFHDQMNMKDLPEIMKTKRIKLQNIVQKKIKTLIYIKKSCKNMLVLGKIKEIIYSLKDPCHINKTFHGYMLLKIGLPNLW